MHGGFFYIGVMQFTVVKTEWSGMVSVLTIQNIYICRKLKAGDDLEFLPPGKIGGV